MAYFERCKYCHRLDTYADDERPWCDCDEWVQEQQDLADLAEANKPWGEQQAQVDWLESRFDSPMEEGEFC